MKITLKKIILCGVGILAAVFFLLSYALAVKVKFGMGLGQEINASFLNCVNGKPFSDVWSYQYMASISSTKTLEGLETTVKTINGAFQILSTIALVLFIFMLLATIGAFFIPSMSGARKLMIPFFAISIAYYPIGLIVMGAFLNVSTSYEGFSMKLSETNVGANFIMYVLGILFFIGMLVASGVVKEIVFVGKDKK